MGIPFWIFWVGPKCSHTCQPQERGRWKFDTEEIQWRCYDAGLENGARSHEPRSLEAGKGKETDSPLELGRECIWHLDISLKNLTVGFWPPELHKKKCIALSHQLCVSSHRKLIQLPKLSIHQEFPGIQTWESSLPAKDTLKVVLHTGKEIPDGRLETQEEWRAKTVANAGVDLNARRLCRIIHVVVFFSNIWN